MSAPMKTAMPGLAPEPAASRRRAWTVTLLLTAFIVVNFADKAVVGLAAIPIQEDLGLSAERFGLVQSSFFWLFAASAIAFGPLMNRFRLKWLVLALAVLWAVTMIPLVGPTTLGVLVASRVILGAAEGPAYALAMHTTQTWFPADKRALPTMVVGTGSSIGPLLATPILSAIILAYDWHAAFLALIVVGLVWALAWTVFGKEGPQAPVPKAAKDEPDAPQVPYRQLFTQRTVLGIAVILFCAYINTTLKLSWLPAYLQKGLGYDAATAGHLTTLPYAVAAVLGIAVGLGSNRLTARGVSSRWARAVPAGVLVLLAGLAEAAFPFLDRGPLQMAVIAVAFAFTSMAFGISMAVLGDVVPAGRRGVVLSVVTAFYSLAGVIAPYALGFVVDAAPTPAEGFASGFKVTGLIVAAGALAGLLLTDPARDARRLTAAADR